MIIALSFILSLSAFGKSKPSEDSGPRGSLSATFNRDQSQSHGTDLAASYRFPFGVDMGLDGGSTRDVRYDDIQKKDLDYSTGRFGGRIQSDTTKQFSFGIGAEVDGRKDAVYTSRAYLPIQISNNWYRLYVAPETKKIHAQVELNSGIEERTSQAEGYSSSASLYLGNFSWTYSFSEFHFDDEFQFMNRPLLYNLLKTFKPVTISFLDSINARSWSVEMTYGNDYFSVGISGGWDFGLYQGYKSTTGTIFGTYFINDAWSVELSVGSTGDPYTDRSDRLSFASVGATYDFD